jgi:hypothetical protein
VAGLNKITLVLDVINQTFERNYIIDSTSVARGLRYFSTQES